MNSWTWSVTAWCLFCFWFGHCTARGQCGWWDDASSPVCQCHFQSLVICDNLTTSSSLNNLFHSIEDRGVDFLDGLTLVGLSASVFFSPFAGTSVQIQTLDLRESNLSWMTPQWDDTLLSGTSALVLRRIFGLDTWNWSTLALAFDTLQYLEIDESPLKILPNDFASNFHQLVGLGIEGSQLRVIGQRSMHCVHCRSVSLKNNFIESLSNGTFVSFTGPSFHLDLRNNRLKTLPEDMVLVPSPDMDYLRIDLNGNPLKSLTEVTFRTLRNLSSIYIRLHEGEGFLECDCSMSFLSESQFDAEGLFCSSKDFNKTEKIMNFLKSC